MAYLGFRWGPLEAGVHASAEGFSLRAGYSGGLWRRLTHGWLDRRRAAAPAPLPVTVDAGLPQAAAAAAVPPADLAARIASTYWYHTMELAPGVRTPGQFDHTPWLPLYRLPERLDGQRVLDVATYDGYWAFEFERRGAAEVVALDLDRPAELDWPPARLARATPAELSLRFGRGFAIAHEVYRSKVQRVTGSVYDMSPEQLGRFDLVHVGDLLLHLNSPVRALQRVASVCSGRALISELYFPELDMAGGGSLIDYRGGHDDVTWWRFGRRALERMILDAGFARVETLATFRVGQVGHRRNMAHVVFCAHK